LQTKPIFAEGEIISEKEMERISQLKTANSVLAVVELPRHSLAKAQPAKNLVLALDRVQNPGNLGTIIRLADWFGISDIVCSEDSADCFNPKVVQATMGAILRVRVHYTNLPQWLANQRDTKIYGTFLEGENIYSAQLDKAGVIVMGNEGQGISTEVAETVTHKLLIPPYPADRCGSESLNVAVATAVICSEFRRR
jgi:TrmH family RNA methyltransferase